MTTTIIILQWDCLGTTEKQKNLINVILLLKTSAYAYETGSEILFSLDHSGKQ